MPKRFDDEIGNHIRELRNQKGMTSYDGIFWAMVGKHDIADMVLKEMIQWILDNEEYEGPERKHVRQRTYKGRRPDAKKPGPKPKKR